MKITEIIDRIKDYAAVWKAMPRNNEEEMRDADDYYSSEIMPLSAAKFLAEYAEADKKYFLMFVTVGTSWQPVALSILAKKPSRVVFLYTEGVKKEVENAIEFIKEFGFNLKYDLKAVDKADSTGLLKTVRAYADYVKEGNVCFDITGGTKAMAAAGAMAANDIGAEIFYIESRYLPVYRKPEPGTEVIIKLNRPKDI